MTILQIQSNLIFPLKFIVHLMDQYQIIVKFPLKLVDVKKIFFLLPNFILQFLQSQDLLCPISLLAISLFLFVLSPDYHPCPTLLINDRITDIIFLIKLILQFIVFLQSFINKLIIKYSNQHPNISTMIILYPKENPHPFPTQLNIRKHHQEIDRVNGICKGQVI